MANINAYIGIYVPRMTVLSCVNLPLLSAGFALHSSHFGSSSERLTARVGLGTGGDPLGTSMRLA